MGFKHHKHCLIFVVKNKIKLALFVILNDLQAEKNLNEYFVKVLHFTNFRKCTKQNLKINLKDLWLDWVKDEQKLVENESDRQKVNSLFLKAVEDYLCKMHTSSILQAFRILTIFMF